MAVCITCQIIYLLYSYTNMEKLFCELIFIFLFHNRVPCAHLFFPVLSCKRKIDRYLEKEFGIEKLQPVTALKNFLHLLPQVIDFFLVSLTTLLHCIVVRIVRLALHILLRKLLLKVSKNRKQIFQPKLLPKTEPSNLFFGRSFGW